MAEIRSPSASIVVSQLTRVYQPVRGRAVPRVALDAIDLEIPAGEVHGLLGPNGAGKTTLCKILSTVLLPTSGRALIGGRDVVADPVGVRRMVGLVFGGERGLYTRLTARQNLRFWAALARVPRARAGQRVAGLLERVGLAERADERVETFSRGMKQRLHLARGLVGDPPVLILDEPTSGLDPVGARDFRTLIGELQREGRTVLVTTHDMAEAEAVCDRVSLLDRGQVLRTEDPRTIGTWISSHERIDAAGVDDFLCARLAKVPGVARVERLGEDRVRVHTSAEGATAAVLRMLVDDGVVGLSTSRPSLQEVYLQVIGDRGMSV